MGMLLSQELLKHFHSNVPVEVCGTEETSKIKHHQPDERAKIFPQRTGCRVLPDMDPQDPLPAQTITMLLQGIILIPYPSHFTDTEPRTRETKPHLEEEGELPGRWIMGLSGYSPVTWELSSQLASEAFRDIFQQTMFACSEDHPLGPFPVSRTEREMERSSSRPS